MDMEELLLVISKSSDQQIAVHSDKVYEYSSGWMNARYAILSAFICAFLGDLFWYTFPCPTDSLSFLCAGYMQIIFICLGFISIWVILSRLRWGVPQHFQ